MATLAKGNIVMTKKGARTVLTQTYIPIPPGPAVLLETPHAGIVNILLINGTTVHIAIEDLDDPSEEAEQLWKSAIEHFAKDIQNDLDTIADKARALHQLLSATHEDETAGEQFDVIRSLLWGIGNSLMRYVYNAVQAPGWVRVFDRDTPGAETQVSIREPQGKGWIRINPGESLTRRVWSWGKNHTLFRKRITFTNRAGQIVCNANEPIPTNMIVIVLMVLVGVQARLDEQKIWRNTLTPNIVASRLAKLVKRYQ